MKVVVCDTVADADNMTIRALNEAPFFAYTDARAHRSRHAVPPVGHNARGGADARDRPRGLGREAQARARRA